MTIKIVALGGSLSQQSTSLAALRVALEGASQMGAEVELFDVRELALPMYAPNAASVPDAARALCESVYTCQGTQLRTLGGEVARAAEHFAVGRITSPEAARAEATLQPVSESEARTAKSS
jgi:NADPH-dependent FMN reductase